MKIISRKEAMAAGLTHYFTGKPCPHGHIAKRFVSSFNCQACAVEKHKEYRTDDGFKAREKASKAAYRAVPENRQKELDYMARRWREDPAYRAMHTASRLKHREKINARQRVANMTPEQYKKYKAHMKRNYQKFREKYLILAKVQRGIRKGAEGKFTKSDVERIFNAQKFRCATCNVCLKKHKYQMDHIMPLSKGGSNWPSNIQALCVPCNQRKRAKHPLEWARENGMLL